jgi:hypothetical protein
VAWILMNLTITEQEADLRFLLSGVAKRFFHKENSESGEGNFGNNIPIPLAALAVLFVNIQTKDPKGVW